VGVFDFPPPWPERSIVPRQRPSVATKRAAAEGF
jgi:hypothetical protein